MSHRRRLLNLVTENILTGVCSLHHINLHLPKNNLFYRTATDAWQLSPSDFPELKKMERIRLGKPRMSKTVFLDVQSNGAFLYDDDERCVVTLPNLHNGKYSSIRLSINGTGVNKHGFKEDDSVFVMESSPVPVDAANSESEFKFEALIHRKEAHDDFSNMNHWNREDLPPPPYVSDAGYISTRIDSYGVADGVVYVSTKGIGTYCFDTASRTWSKAGDWALPFSGKVEHVPELGLLVGLLPRRDLGKGHFTLRLRLPCAMDESLLLWRGEQLTDALRRRGVHRTETMKETYDHCNHEKVDKRFAVFIGVEVVRCGKDGDDKLTDTTDTGEAIEVIKHKSKVYLFDKDENIVVQSVL
ncbi:hypothetical protein QOZ80_9BG0699270 [Eleusine coracana subsp. coracana]|nr:hypothetical protein QOZ80_9BG0699270 [Eleusine coracana subsp. coracana]